MSLSTPITSTSVYQIAMSDKSDISAPPINKDHRNASFSTQPMLMRAQIEAEMVLAHSSLERRIELLRKALGGVASNGTSCLMCQALNKIATERLAEDDLMR